MNRTMKQWLLPLICRWFGHKDFEEVYCVKSPRNWFCRQNKPNRYDVVHDIVCSRCRRVHRTILKSRISRAQLLHDGWFIIDESHEKQKSKGIYRRMLESSCNRDERPRQMAATSSNEPYSRNRRAGGRGKDAG